MNIRTPLAEGEVGTTVVCSADGSSELAELGLVGDGEVAEVLSVVGDACRSEDEHPNSKALLVNSRALVVMPTYKL
jgi:hypothetical protein